MPVFSELEFASGKLAVQKVNLKQESLIYPEPRIAQLIRHIVFFTAKPDQDIADVLDGLSILKNIPHAQKLEVTANRKSDPISQEVDVVVYGEFENAEALTAYKAHDLYQESIRRVRPIREMRLAADVEF